MAAARRHSITSRRLRHGHGAVGADYGEAALGENQIGGGRLQQVRSDGLGLFDHALGGQHHRAARDLEAARAAVAAALGGERGVRLAVGDALGGMPRWLARICGITVSWLVPADSEPSASVSPPSSSTRTSTHSKRLPPVRPK